MEYIKDLDNSHPSQLYAVKLFEPDRVDKARKAIEKHYNWQRERYGKAFKEMGLGVYTGDGGFYHWLELPEGLNATEFNKRLFKRGDPGGQGLRHGAAAQQGPELRPALLQVLPLLL